MSQQGRVTQKISSDKIFEKGGAHDIFDLTPLHKYCSHNVGMTVLQDIWIKGIHNDS